MMKVAKISLLSLFLTLLSAPAWAQVGSMQGKVVDENGDGVRDAVIKIERLDVKGSYSVKTRKKGTFFHAGLPLGRYKVTLEIDGKVIDAISRIPVGMGDNKPVDFELADINKRNQAAQAAAVLRERGVGTAVIKLGAHGVYYASANESGFVPPFRVAAVDTVAAGDAFNGGLAVALAEGQPMAEAIRWGAAAGAIATTRP